MNDRIECATGPRAQQPVGIQQIHHRRIGAYGSEPLPPALGSGEPEHAMTRCQQLGHQSATDGAGGSGH